MGNVSEIQREINFASLAYLNLWFRTDRHHMLRSTSPVTGTGLRKIAAKYMVARGISMKDAKGEAVSSQERDRRWSQAADMVSKARGLAEGNAAVVGDLAAKLGKLDARDYDRTSAATKFLWFAGRHTIRILDVRAVRALRHLHQPPRGTKIDYSWFENTWNNQFDRCATELGRAVLNLPNQFSWSVIPEQWEKLALTAIRNPWFRDRVFDQYLWAKGEGAGTAAT